MLNKGNYYGLLKASFRHLVDDGYLAEPWLCRLFASADRSVCDGWRMTEDEHTDRISEISEKMKRSFYTIAEGESPGDALFAATMALACFIYDVTSRGAEGTVAKRSAELLTDAVAHMVKEDLN